MDEIENIEPFARAPWDKRGQMIAEETEDQTTIGYGVKLAVNSSARNGMVGAAEELEIATSALDRSRREVFSTILRLVQILLILIEGLHFV